MLRNTCGRRSALIAREITGSNDVPPHNARRLPNYIRRADRREREREKSEMFMTCIKSNFF